VAFWAFFLVLRVFDEHKDFAADCVAHPERALQRGVISLGDLRVVGWLAAAVTLGVTLWHDGVGAPGRATAWWLAVAIWSVLMAREFFVRDWLRRRLVPYALSHMCVMPLAIGWVVAMSGYSLFESPATLAFLGLSFASGLTFEVARKMRSPSDERPMAETYTGALGVRAASDLLLVVTVSAIVLGVIVARLAVGAVHPLLAVSATMCAVAAGVVVLDFRRQPSSSRAKAVEAAAGVTMLVAHLALIAAIVLARGLELQ
jgi:4-hydroxybenzoate polyprenyltransferase